VESDLNGNFSKISGLKKHTAIVYTKIHFLYYVERSKRLQGGKYFTGRNNYSPETVINWRERDSHTAPPVGACSVFLQHLSIPSLQGIDSDFVLLVLKASNIAETNTSDAVRMNMFFFFMSLGLIILCGQII
jgi:hypothetical protein